MKKKFIQLPKNYLSYSQASLWIKNPTQYAALYFDQRDELRFTNPGQAYGKVVADALERGVQTGDLLTDAATLLLPKYDIMDVEFRAETKTPAGWIEVLAKPDSLDSDTKAFLEYKTGNGKTPWTQEKAQKHLQMLWYATAIYLKHKVIPRAKLIWIETAQDTEGVVKPTGRVEEFEVVYTLGDILATMALMSRVAKEIAIAWAAHETNPEFTTF